jgi:REP element-mobilizing transposase RayT
VDGRDSLGFIFKGSPALAGSCGIDPELTRQISFRIDEQTAKRMKAARRDYGFLLVGYVVMPNHVHLLMSEPKKGTPSTVMQMLKQRVSRKMRMKGRAIPKGQLPLRFPKFAADCRSSGSRGFTTSMSTATRRKKEAGIYAREDVEK